MYYRVDLRDLFSEVDPLSPRYVLSLVLNLPTDGAFYASRRGGIEFRGWDVDRYLLKALVDSQRATNYILTMVNRDPKKSKPNPPEPFPSPDVEAKQSNPRQGSFAAMAATMLAAQRRKKELLSG